MRRRKSIGAIVLTCAATLIMASTAAALVSPNSPDVREIGPVPYGVSSAVLDLDGRAFDLVFSPAGDLAYVSTRRRISIVDLNEWKVIDEIPIDGGTAIGIELFDGGTTLAVVVLGAREVLEIDLATKKVVAVTDLDGAFGVLGDGNPFDIAAIDDSRFLVAPTSALTGGFGGQVVVVDRSDRGNPTRIAGVLVGALGGVQADPAAGYAIVMADGFPATSSLVRLDTTSTPPTIESTSGWIGDSTEIAVDDVLGRIYTTGGVVLDLEDLSVVGTSVGGIPVLSADGSVLYSVTKNLITAQSTDSMTVVDSWVPTCPQYPETFYPHDARLDPSGENLILLGEAGICLEPLDGSGRPPAILRVDVRPTVAGVDLLGSIVVVTTDGEVVYDETGVLFNPNSYPTDDRRIDLETGEYRVLVVRPVTSPGQWPFVPARHDGLPLLSRAELVPLSVSGDTTIQIDVDPFFYDLVDTSQTFWSSIQWLQATAITTGCGPTSFCPNDFVTRGQMAAFLDRALALPEGGPSGFVDDAGIFRQNIANLKAAGITTGCAPDRFCTDDFVTRAQMAAFLDRALDLPDGGPTPFTDDDGTFEQNIANLFLAEITTGCAPDRFCTDDFVTRAQMAAFLERALADDWLHR
jgi:S-layer family protein